MRSKLFLLFLFLSPAGFAQVVVSTNASVTVLPGSVLFSSGDFVNHGSLTNNGSLIISGAWTNTGNYTSQNGQVTFNGPGQQIINHNAQSFARLYITGGGEKICKADIYITEELSLQDGILASENQSKIIINQAGVVTGGSDQSFVQGALYLTGTGEKVYPVGINATFLPLTFTNVSGTSPVVGIEVLEPNPNINKDVALKSVSSLRYWQVSTLSGTFAGSPVMIPLTGEDASLPLVVAQSAGPNDPFHPLGGTIDQGFITSHDDATLARIAIGEEHSRNILVYNVVTPGNNDGKHDFLKIVNIEQYPNNEVTIVNRWGDKVFQITGYNNKDRYFEGDGNTGGAKALSDGTYFYVVDKKNGEEKISGFFILRR